MCLKGGIQILYLSKKIPPSLEAGLAGLTYSTLFQ